jgi:hypothetical protein
LVVGAPSSRGAAVGKGVCWAAVDNCSRMWAGSSLMASYWGSPLKLLWMARPKSCIRSNVAELWEVELPQSVRL